MNHTMNLISNPRSDFIYFVCEYHVLLFLFLSRIIERDNAQSFRVTDNLFSISKIPDDQLSIRQGVYRPINPEEKRAAEKKKKLSNKNSLFSSFFRAFYSRILQRIRNSIRQSSVNESMTYQERGEELRRTRKKRYDRFEAEVRWNEILVRAWLTLSLRPTR